MMQVQGKEEKQGSATQRWIEEGIFWLIFAALGALFAATELLFGVRPFGIALAAAVGKLFPAVALGMLIFSLFTGEYVYLGALAILLLLRMGAYLYAALQGRAQQLFEERMALRVLFSAVSVFVTGTYALLQGGFRYYYLWGVICGTLVAALCAFLISGMFYKASARFSYVRESAIATLFLMGIFAMRGIEVFGVYPAAVGGALACFFLAAHYGSLLGGTGGFLCGLCFYAPLAPGFLLCGICFGFLQKSSRGAGILSGCAAAAVYGYGVMGAASISLILPSFFVAGALFLAGDSIGVIEGSPVRRLMLMRQRSAEQGAGALEAARNEERMRELSLALGDLSGMLYELSGKQRRPGRLDLRHLCDAEFDKVCPACPHREACWGNEYAATASGLEALANRLYSTGRVERSELPPALISRCSALPRVMEGIARGAEQLFEQVSRGDKTSVVAMDYAVIGRIVQDTLETGKKEFSLDSALGERIYIRLQREGYVLESVSVCGKGRRRVLVRGLRLPGRRVKVRELRTLLEHQCKFSLGEAEVSEHMGSSDYLFLERAKYCAVCIKQSRAKNAKDGAYCGDSVSAFAGTDGYHYALLCDGMGSGNSAALTSALSATVLSKMLRAGNRADTALRLLNGLLGVRGQRENEASTTVDLLQIDCVSGEGVLYKCGAAPTYLLRAGQITRFFSHTAPVGILEALDAERLSFAVQPGDVLVQISDGISGGEEDCPWLADMLLERYDGDAEGFARMVLNRASNEGADDLSVLITQISEAPIPSMQEMPRAAS